MKISQYLLLLCLLYYSPAGYAMNKKLGAQSQRHWESFQDYYDCLLDTLQPELRQFVEDYATWSQKEKNKLDIAWLGEILGEGRVTVNTRPRASNNYAGNIQQYLDTRMTDRVQNRTLCAILDYLKSKK